jgi:cell envelope opacity-associated protein A
MALAPADFAAYSRATGTPYPEDPEEKAQLAPSVAEFRRNQLQAPQQESNLPGILGATALGLGALAGGIGLARALGRTKASVASSPQSDLTPKGRSDVAVVDRYARQRAAEDLTRQARSERPAGVVQADLSNVQVKRSLLPTEAEAIEQYSRRLSQDFPEPTASEMEALNAPSRTSKILARLGTSPQYRPDPKDINYPRFGPPSPEVAAARREQASQDLLRFAQQRQEDAALVTNQTIGALESGEDQMTGRTMMGVQRNEDLDASQVNAVARQTGSADVAASMTPDGIPVDQAEGRSGDYATIPGT